MDPNKSERDFEPNETFTKRLKKYFRELFKDDLSSEEVEEKQKSVWQKIDASLDQQEKKRNFIPFAIAASITAITGVTAYLFLSLPMASEMETLASNWSIEEQKSTQLILSEEETIFMEDEESVIDYTGAGAIAVNAKVSDRKDVSDYNSLIVPYGKRSKVLLEDGTVVWVNSGSKLIYPVTFTDNKREVYLEGEAYFEVNEDKSKPFIVQTKIMDIKVLGTGFNITAYGNDDKASAVLVHGSIELHVNKYSLFGSKKQVISPKERAVYNAQSNTINVREVDTEYYVSWKDGYIKFNNSQLHNIIAKLEKYYAVEISISDKDLLNKTFTGKLDLKQDIDEVISIISATTTLTYTKEERRFVLYKE